MAAVVGGRLQKAAIEAEARAKRTAGYELAEDVRYNQREHRPSASTRA